MRKDLRPRLALQRRVVPDSRRRLTDASSVDRTASLAQQRFLPALRDASSVDQTASLAQQAAASVSSLLCVVCSYRRFTKT